MTPKILAFAGSTRTESLNKKLIRCASRLIDGDSISLIDLRDFPLPIYDGDLEANEGLPENAKKLKKLFLEHQGLLIASPENNSSYSAVLKNAIDWVSRPDPSESEYLICFKNKFAGLLSASPGALGGLRGLAALRLLLENVGTLVYPTQFTLGSADKQFDSNGKLTDQKKEESLKAMLEGYLNLITKML
ncbi:MAG: NAD(P)H-dependent oxidoreductase [Chlamydiales bacterium]|nr:NAD(P)H-dependent oxidoreductase [Chlamydiales bacterium]